MTVLTGLPIHPFNAHDPPAQGYTNLHARGLSEDDRSLIDAHDNASAQHIPDRNDVTFVDGREPPLA